MIREPQVPVDYPAKEASQIAIDNDNNLQRILSDPMWLLQNQYCCDKINLYTPRRASSLRHRRSYVDTCLCDEVARLRHKRASARVITHTLLLIHVQL